MRDDESLASNRTNGRRGVAMKFVEGGPVDLVNKSRWNVVRVIGYNKDRSCLVSTIDLPCHWKR